MVIVSVSAHAFLHRLPPPLPFALQIRQCRRLQSPQRSRGEGSGLCGLLTVLLLLLTVLLTVLLLLLTVLLTVLLLLLTQPFQLELQKLQFSLHVAGGGRADEVRVV